MRKKWHMHGRMVEILQTLGKLYLMLGVSKHTQENYGMQFIIHFLVSHVN